MNIKFETRTNFTPFKRLIEWSKKYKIKVGVLKGDKYTTRRFYNESGDITYKKNNLTIAEYGKLQEFGDVELHIPERSFIRMPLICGAFKKEIERHKKTILHFIYNEPKIRLKIYNSLDYMGNLAKYTINYAFNTQGFGSWADNSPTTQKRKGTSAVLFWEGELYNHINYKIERVYDNI